MSDDARYIKRKITDDDLNNYLEDCDEFDRFHDHEEKLRYTANPVFKIGQIYEKHAVFKLECNVCGSDKFQIGYHSCLTVSKCCGCGTETIVHDG